MPDVKAYLVSDATAITNLSVDDDLMNSLPAGEYNLTLSSAATVTVPTLTAGTIVQNGDILSVNGSNAPSSAAFNWQIDGVSLSPAVETATINKATYGPGDYTRGVRIPGVQDTFVYTAPFTVEAPAAAGITIAASGTPTNVTAVRTVSVDVSAYSAGEKLILFCGVGQVASSVTVNGNVATILETFNPGTARRGALAEYTLQAADISAGTVDVVFTLPSSTSLTAYAVLHAPAGSIVTPIAKASGPTSQSVTPTNATNHVVSIIFGEDERFSGAEGVVYTGGVAAPALNTWGSNTGIAVGIVANASTSGITVTATSDGTGNWAGFLFVVE